MRNRLLFTLIVLVCIGNAAMAQEKWGLQKCIAYALANNISIKQAVVQAQIAGVQYDESKQGQYPSLSFGGNGSFNSGTNQDPTTFTRITQSYLSSTVQLQASAQIFNWYSKQNTINANRWQEAAAKASADNVTNNIILSVCNAYLQVLLARAQDSVAAGQLRQSQAQLSNTQKLVNAGSLPELNAAELEAQVATDSATLIAAEGNVTQDILALKADLNMDAGTVFDVDQPPVELIPVENLADLQPETVYALAIANLPQERVDNDKLKAAQYNAAVAKAGMYPVFSAFGALGSVFNSADQLLSANPVFSSVGTVDVGGTTYPVFPIAPLYTYNYGKIPFFDQLNQNFRQQIGISVSVPILSGGSLRGAWKIAVLDVKNQSLQNDADNQTLKQNIYQAYTAALVALDKFNAQKKTLETTQRSLDFAQKRYDVGLLGTLELITDKNNLFSAQLQFLQDQFDYVFKMKVLEFYKGQGLKL